MPEYCDGCFQILPDRYFSPRSYALPDEVWCCTCLGREHLGLPLRVPNFQLNNGYRKWVVDTWPPHNKDHQAFLLLYMLAAYMEHGIDDITVRELFYRFQRKLSHLRILQLIHKLERNGWLIVHWATEEFMVNRYELNYERRPVIHHDPHERTYSNRKETK